MENDIWKLLIWRWRLPSGTYSGCNFPFCLKGHGMTWPSHTGEGNLAFLPTAFVVISSLTCSGGHWLSVPLPRYARPKRKWLLLCNPPLPLELSHGPLEGWLVGAQHRTIGRTPLSVLILAIHKTHGKTCSFLKKKSKQTAHAHRWETCIQKKRKRERECFCLQSSFHLAHDWSKLIWVNVGLWSSHGKPESPFIQSHQGHHCLGGTMHGGHTQPHTLHTPSRKTWAFPKRKWRQTAHCTEIAFVPSCHLEQEPGRSKLRGGR